MSPKRIIAVVLLLPITMPFAAVHAIAEWWHFGPSSGLLGVCRRVARWRDNFFNGLDGAISGEGKANG